MPLILIPFISSLEKTAMQKSVVHCVKADGEKGKEIGWDIKEGRVFGFCLGKRQRKKSRKTPTIQPSVPRRHTKSSRKTFGCVFLWFIMYTEALFVNLFAT
ncbi:hypothetical protein CHARACLAT_031128 [Characodon lateralis]|uniref:Uncharacterized protein n=1 Tax=Characodon lateralis TaxID=208331 RepID=A0ABU7D4E1_9TELE|nr:hypothetical protein [Characodon lateralis]